MLQGFSLTAEIFHTILRQLLQNSPTLLEKTLLIQYVDDLLIKAQNQETCLSASLSLLQYLAELGFLVKKSKLQLVCTRVQFLGAILSGRGCKMNTSQRHSNLTHKQPQTVKQMQSFLGLINFSRHFIPDYSMRTASLRGIIKMAGVSNPRMPLEWTSQAFSDFLTKQLMPASISNDRGRNIYWATTALFWIPLNRKPHHAQD